MSHSGIYWQAGACLYWHTFVFLLFFTPSFPLSGSLIQFQSCSLSNHSPCLCLSTAFLLHYTQAHNVLQLMSKGCTFSVYNWSAFLFTTRTGCAFLQIVSLRGCGWCGDNVRVPQCGAQLESQPACTTATHEIWCHALFKVPLLNH